jgi:ribosome maturation protein SDO1
MSKQSVVKYKGLELLCKAETVAKYREGKLKADDCLLAEIIFKNASKADQASSSDLKKVFGTDNLDTSIKTMLDKGSFQLTKNELKEKVAQKRIKLCALLNDTYVNPKNSLPYTITMWDSILTEYKITVDPDTPADSQMNDVKKKLLGKVAMAKVDQMELILILKHDYWAKISGSVYQTATIVREKYLPKEVKMELAMRPSDFVKLSAELNKIADGDYYLETKESYVKSKRPEQSVLRKPAKGKNKNKQR